MDDLSREEILRFEKEFLDFVGSRYSSWLEALEKEKKLNESMEQSKEILQEFKAIFQQQAKTQ